MTTSRYGLTERSNSITEKLLSATATIRRSGNQRAVWRSAWRPQSVSFLCRRPWLLCIALGGRQDGQERQGPDAAGPGNGREQHDAQPAQTTRFDKVAMAGADRVPVDAARLDLRSPPALDRVIEADDDRPVPDKGDDQQVQQPMGHRRADQDAVLSTR